jgi:hypothetical protein
MSPLTAAGVDVDPHDEVIDLDRDVAAVAPILPIVP